MLRRDGQHCPTRLADGSTVENHCDLACLRDAAAAGVLVFAWPHARFTQEGTKLAAWLLSWWDTDTARRNTLTWSEALEESRARLGEVQP